MLVLDRSQGKCELCGSDDKVVIHHNNGYSNEPEDLVCLCTKCHGTVHSSGWGGQIPRDVLSMSPISPENVLPLSDKSKSKSKSKREIYKEKSSLSEILESVVPDDRLKKAFREFIEMREKIKSPLTENALRLAIKKASDLSGGDIETAVAVVEQSVLNDWKGLYALKEPQTASKGDWFADYYQKYGQEGDAQ